MVLSVFSKTPSAKQRVTDLMLGNGPHNALGRGVAYATSRERSEQLAPTGYRAFLLSQPKLASAEPNRSSAGGTGMTDVLTKNTP